MYRGAGAGPLQAYREGSLGATPGRLQSFRDGSLGAAGPLQAFREGSLGSDCGCGCSGTGEYFSPNSIGEYFSTKGLGALTEQQKKYATYGSVALGVLLFGIVGVKAMKKRRR